MAKCKCKEHKKLIEKLVEWFESQEVQDTFSMAATNSIVRPHMAVQVDVSFGQNAQKIWDEAKDVAHNK